MLLVASLVLAGTLAAAPSSHGSDLPSLAAPADDVTIDAYLSRARDELGLPGLALAVVRVGRPTHLFVTGRANDGGTPITDDTPFLLASTSKAFTATAVMQLVEAGRLDLDAPVRRYLPWFALASEDASARLTLRQLLTQTSGLTTREGTAYQAGDDQDAGALERNVRSLAGVQLVSAPGDTYHYSNLNYDVLGLIVQTVSGEPFDRYLAEHVYGPLGMTHSHATHADAVADGLAEGYYQWFGAAWRPTYMSQPRAGAPSATTYSSIADMGRWVEANLSGGALGGARILSANGIATLHQGAVKIDDFHAYGMGWQTRPLWEALDPTATESDPYRLPLLVEHGGDWPNARTHVGLVPGEGWGFALLVNAGDEAGDRLSQLEQNVLRLLAGQQPTAGPPAVDLLISGRYAVVIGLFVAELASLGWAARTVWRTRRRKLRIGRRRLALSGLAALVMDVIVAALYLVFLPDRFDTDFVVLLRSVPDIALFAAPSIALAVVWGPIRTLALAAIHFRGSQASLETADVGAPEPQPLTSG
jgi:CubicO group peptidase (beta-lactamase class C family)